MPKIKVPDVDLPPPAKRARPGAGGADVDVPPAGRKPAGAGGADVDVPPGGKKPAGAGGADADVPPGGKKPGAVDDLVDGTGKVKPEVKKKWGRWGGMGELMVGVGMLGLTAAGLAFLPSGIADGISTVADSVFGWAPEELRESLMCGSCSSCCFSSSCCLICILILVLTMSSGGGNNNG